MDAMYLSNKKNNRLVTDHEELEVLLESFSKQVEEIVNEAENIEVAITLRLWIISCWPVVQSNVQSTQEIVELILDSNRNALLALDLKARFPYILTCLAYLIVIRSQLLPLVLVVELW